MSKIDTRAALRMAVRDLLIVAVTLAAWGGVIALEPERAQVLAFALAVVAGALTAFSSYLVHEWGHLTGAWFGGATVEVADRPSSVFLFRFDTGRSSRREFLAMSVGGFVASAIAVAFLVLVLPLEGVGGTAGMIALGLAALGVVATFILEVPVAWQVARGAPLPSGSVYVSSSGSR